ncbi:MAG: AMP-binding protein [Verrucomicrobiae bacterium]|nr:AMP-binding protein [Verrucomicrobiae bacterium]
MNLSQRFLETAARQADKTAIYYGTESRTYGQLGEQTVALASLLRGRFGVASGDRVGLWLRNRPEFVPALMGALHAGAVVVPINNFLKPEEVAYHVEDAGIGVLITDGTMDEALGALRARCPELKVWSVDEIGGLDGVGNGDGGMGEAKPEDLAVLVYTSGTTGRPKGAMLTHGNLLHNVESCRRILEIVDHDRFVLMLPMFHSFMLTVCILLPLVTGGSIVLIQSLHPAKAMIGEILMHRGSILPAMAQVFRALAGMPAGVELPLRLCISGAGPLPNSILEAFQARFPRIPLIEGYGLSEASPVVSVNPVRGPAIPGTIGLPIPDVEVTIQDDEGQMLGDLEDGEICVRGGNVMRGYWNAPDKTAETLRNGWLLTGDIGHRRPDGYLVITDRKKDMLKPNGMNVYPREIEEVIYRFPGIKEAAVVGEPDERRGERAVAFVAAEEGVVLDEAALLGFLKERLADYKLPRRAIVLPALPRNATGKVLKTRLREMLREE